MQAMDSPRLRCLPLESGQDRQALLVRVIYTRGIDGRVQTFGIDWNDQEDDLLERLREYLDTIASEPSGPQGNPAL